MVENQAEDWGVGAAEAGWVEHARGQGPAEVASAPIAASEFPIKQGLHVTT